MAASPSSVLTLGLGDWGTPSLVITTGYGAGAAIVTAAITGTLAGGATETAIVLGGGTIIITLTNDTWLTAGASFDAIRQDIIDGLDSDGAEGTGWNAVVRDALDVSTVVRTSDTEVTVTLPAFAGYDISSAETVTVTVPSAALTLAGPAVTGVPTFTITPVVIPVVVEGGGGGGGGGWLRPNYSKGRKKKALFDEIEDTLRETLFGPEPVDEPAKPAARARAADKLDTALRTLTEIADGRDDLTVRVAALRRAVAEYEAKLAEEEDDEILMWVL